ncbi:MAG: GNAT family N-acetyltransferase [Acidobacteria bacterium]|nr:GNAT family N-acetyltransferase [Acidobacteriota bacterium]
MLSTPLPGIQVDMAVAPTAASGAGSGIAFPTPRGRMADLRAVERRDARALLTLLSSEEVSRFAAPAATNLDAFERFIDWSAAQGLERRQFCFAVVPHGTTAVGLFQVRAIEHGFRSAEWGFAIAFAFWGTGLSADASALVLDFDTLGAHRLEARAVAMNARGTGALLKVGAVQEAVLRRAFLCDDGHQPVADMAAPNAGWTSSTGCYVDQVLWSILDEDWRHTRATWRRQVLVH